MAALNFVAIEDGLEDDPKLHSLARILRVPRSIALWFVFRLRRFVLQQGDHITGSLPKRFNARDVASVLCFDGDPRRLVAALKKQGYLGCRKGRGFYYPGWTDTITGQYACRREEDRQRHGRLRRERAALSNQPPAVVRGQSADASAECLQTSKERLGESKVASNQSRPPDPPPCGGPPSLTSGGTGWRKTRRGRKAGTIARRSWPRWSRRTGNVCSSPTGSRLTHVLLYRGKIVARSTGRRISSCASSHTCVSCTTSVLSKPDY
jgi:hypothetical protein